MQTLAKLFPSVIWCLNSINSMLITKRIYSAHWKRSVSCRNSIGHNSSWKENKARPLRLNHWCNRCVISFSQLLAMKIFLSAYPQVECDNSSACNYTTQWKWSQEKLGTLSQVMFTGNNPGTNSQLAPKQMVRRLIGTAALHAIKGGITVAPEIWIQ